MSHICLNSCVNNNETQCVASRIGQSLKIFEPKNLKKEMKKKQEEILYGDLNLILTETYSFVVEKEMTNKPKELTYTSVENKVKRCIKEHKNIIIFADN